MKMKIKTESTVTIVMSGTEAAALCSVLYQYNSYTPGSMSQSTADLLHMLQELPDEEEG